MSILADRGWMQPGEETGKGTLYSLLLEKSLQSRLPTAAGGPPVQSGEIPEIHPETKLPGVQEKFHPGLGTILPR